MKRITISLFSMFFMLSTFLTAQSNIDGIKRDVEFLSSDALEGRETGTVYEALAAGYIVARFQQAGLTKAGEGDYSFVQEWIYRPRINPHSTKSDTSKAGFPSLNVLGMKYNGAEQTVILGAHYDHLGHGDEGSLHAAKDGQIHNGADDNASGVALIIYLAKQLEGEGFDNYNYLFIAFSGEEKGLMGSNYFAKHPMIELDKVAFMLNFDMVGRLDKDKGLAINGVGTAAEWESILEEANSSNLKLITSESGVGPSDHTSFYLQDLPVLHFFTGQHEDYHKPSDDAAKINYDGVVEVADLVENIISSAAKQGQLSFQKTKEEKKSTPRFTVTLGVMPDYLFDGEGMRIDGILEDRPAQKAGLEKGDIVIQLGEIKVDGMMTYMEALSKFKKGDKTTVKVKREEKTLEVELQF